MHRLPGSCRPYVCKSFTQPKTSYHRLPIFRTDGITVGQLPAALKVRPIDLVPTQNTPHLDLGRGLRIVLPPQGKIFSIGTAAFCSMLIKGDRIAPQHLTIAQASDGSYYLKNSSQQQPVELKEGDRISLSLSEDTQLVFTFRTQVTMERAEKKHHGPNGSANGNSRSISSSRPPAGLSAIAAAQRQKHIGIGPQ